MLTKLLIICAIFTSSFAFADDKIDRTQLNADLASLQPVVVVNNGIKGVWYTPTDATKILDIISKRLPLALDIIDGQTRQVAVLNSAITDYTSVIKQYKDISDLKQKMFDTVMGNLDKLTPPPDPWYESHRLIFSIGVISGVAVTIGAAYAVGAVASHIAHQ